MKRLVTCLTMVVIALFIASSAALAQQHEFKLGFKLLADQIPDIVGQPLEDEWHNVENGDGLQRTTTGMMVWRKADNATAFTNGHMTWIYGPEGLQSRLNTERFAWEAGAAGAPPDVSPSVPPPAPAAPASTPDPQAGQTVYEDPAGRFSVPVPTNWTTQSTDSYLLLQDPDGVIKMHVLAVPGDSAESGIAAAWAVLDPDFSLPVRQTSHPPTTPGLDEIVAITYDAGEQRVVQAVGQRVQEQVYVLIVDGPTDAVVRRASQIQIVGSGLTIKGLEKTDLTGTQPRALTPEMLAELESYIAETMAATGVPGAEVAIVQDGEVVYQNGFGVREMGKTDPVTPDTLMMIGSTGKTMTTMMMATMVDDGKMQWDTPAVEILPSFAVADPELSQRITMRNLVCACTGVPRRDMELIFNGRHLTAEDIVASLRGFQFFTGFGEAFQYSNQMVGAGGYIAALAGSGEPEDLYQGYLAQMQQRVFEPIGMANTTFSFGRVEATSDRATPHGADMLRQYHPIPLSTEQLLTPIAPAGASWSNARDMARYLITEMNEGVNPEGMRVVSAENLKVTWEPQVAVSAESSYGLGWFVDEYHGLPMLHHGGNTLGFSTDLAFLPAAKLGIVVIANAQGSNLFNQAVRFRLLELAYGLPMEFDAQFQFGLTTIREIVAERSAGLQETLDAGELAPYLGTFTNDALGDITLALQGDRLTMTSESFETELRRNVDQTGKTTYVMYDGPIAGAPLQLERDGAGDPIIVLPVPPDNYQFRRR